ncbi:hypothetical protein [Mesoplasma melaleucae]|uniref:N-acetyltransferase domain-containing protein n=1 Tax=Mesoplasma melaleucae TaxID=81459 RepID=A0A2K8NYQ9_9MOLU|nr:hypothetical protein [Mesoplasma melaleucae]ATZ18338.1 hypothetical protein EMELA_v1c08540 [Mesoplasma melaleucae]
MRDTYDIVFDHKDNKHFNQDLSNLIKRSPNDNFEKWLFKDKQLENFSPITIVNQKNEIIAALGILKFDVFISGEKCSAVQVGNFFVKEAYQKENLEEILIEAAIYKYSNLVDILISYCGLKDEEILKKSGFERRQEYLFFLPWNNKEKMESSKIVKLDLSTAHDFELVKEALLHSSKQSNILDTKGDSLVKFHNIQKYFEEDLWYIPSLETVVCFRIKDGVFDFIASFSPHNIDLPELLNIVVPNGIKRIDFGFMPDIKEGVHITKTDSFIRTGLDMHSCLYLKEVTTGLRDKKFMFPILSRQK